jgi:uncharacterized membrane protein YfcA
MMSAPVAALLLLTMVATSTLSGIFGMAGGMILIGVLFLLLPLPEAMALHAVTQIASNGWRAAFNLRHVRWRSVAAIATGFLLATAAWSAWRFVPDKPLAFIALGLSPFVLSALARTLKPDPERFGHGVALGAASMSLMLLTGVSGPLIDRFFLGGKLDRHGIVATKAVCQVGGHLLKLVYFGALIADPGALDPWLAAGGVAASLLGTLFARPLLAALSETAYRLWAGRIITAIALAYVAQGSWLLIGR